MGVRVGVIGASGYAGIELVRLLTAHPEAELTRVAAGRAAGQPLGASWPGLPPQLAAMPVVEPDAADLARTCDAVFLALPHGISATLVPALLDAGVAHVIDLGADFRLRSRSTYAAAYGHTHPCPQLLETAVYGLPELHRDAIRGARLVANPGCYPTATAIAALPLVEQGGVDWLVSSCLSGVSGAGRKAGPRNLFCEVSESAVAYGLAGSHRHTPEMEQTLGVPVSFTPHLVPMSRGMLATVHARLDALPTPQALRGWYLDRYADHPMVVVRDQPPATAEVRGTATAHVFPAVDAERSVVTVVCAIDNLGKGAAGQAVHNLNLAAGLPETAGLPTFPVLP